MQIETTPREAELLVAVLYAAEGSLAGEIAMALRDLRHWRTALLIAYFRARREEGAESEVSRA